MNKLALYIKGLGLMVGMIFGAGASALPYVFSKAGLFWGIFHLFFALFFILVLHLFYADISFASEERMRFLGQIRRFLGKKYEPFALSLAFFSYYGTLLVYGLLGGVFINNLWPQTSLENMILAFFFVSGILILLRLEKTALLNFYLTIPIFLFILYLFGLSLPHANAANFLVFNNNHFWFLPYGVWLFSLSGFAAIPEARDVFYQASLKDFRRVIILSILVSLFFYLVFTAAVLGVSGSNTAQDAIGGLKNILGQKIVFSGSIIGFLAVFTSALGLGSNLKNIFRFDYKRSYLVSWLLVVLPPPLLYFLGFQNFISLIQIIGAVSLGLGGIFIILMRQNIGLLNSGNHFIIRPNKTLDFILILGLVLGSAFEIYTVIFRP